MYFSRLSLLSSFILLSCSVHAAPVVSHALVSNHLQLTSSLQTTSAIETSASLVAPDIFLWRRENTPSDPITAPNAFKGDAGASADSPIETPGHSPSSAHVLAPGIWARDTTSTSSRPVKASAPSPPVVVPDMFLWRREAPASPIKVSGAAEQSPSVARGRDTIPAEPIDASSFSPSSTQVVAQDISRWRRSWPCARKRNDVPALAQPSSLITPDLFCWV